MARSPWDAWHSEQKTIQLHKHPKHACMNRVLKRNTCPIHRRRSGVLTRIVINSKALLPVTHGDALVPAGVPRSGRLVLKQIRLKVEV